MAHFEKGTEVEVSELFFKAVERPYKKIVGVVIETNRELVSIRKSCCGAFFYIHQTWLQRIDDDCCNCWFSPKFCGIACLDYYRNTTWTHENALVKYYKAIRSNGK